MGKGQIFRVTQINSDRQIYEKISNKEKSNTMY